MESSVCFPLFPSAAVQSCLFLLFLHNVYIKQETDLSTSISLENMLSTLTCVTE